MVNLKGMLLFMSHLKLYLITLCNMNEVSVGVLLTFALDSI